MENNQLRRWRVKDTVLSPWQDLPGRYTAAQISGMHRQGCFAAAMPVDDAGHRLQDDEARSPYLSQN
jgi:hypothetical protein